MRVARATLVFQLLCLLPLVCVGAGDDSLVKPAEGLATIDVALRAGDWGRAEEASRVEIDRLRPVLLAGPLASAVARLALAEAGAGHPDEALWHWQVAQNLDREVLSEAVLRTFGAPGDFLARHPLRLAGQDSPGLEVGRSGAAGLSPPRKQEGTLELSPVLRSLSVPLWLRAQVIIDAEGRPREPVLLAASLPGMAFEVLEAVRSWRFQPARIGEQAVPSFYQLTLNPPEGKPLEALTQARPDLEEVENLLRAGRWKEARKKLRQAVSAQVEESPDAKQMGYALALQAFAEAGLGMDDEAICHWQAAQHLDPRLYHADLSPYGPAGEVLAAHRWGTDGTGLSGDERMSPPSVKGSPRLTVPAVASPARGSFVLTGVVNALGHLRQPRTLSFEQTEGPSVVEISALDAICYWRFEPARLADEPQSTVFSWLVEFDRTRPKAEIRRDLAISREQQMLVPRHPRGGVPNPP